MKKLPFVIGAVTVYAAFYQLAPFLSVPTSLIIVLFLFSPFVVTCMAYVILKYGTPSTNTFEEKFYDDCDYRPLKADEQPR
jgi:hypothetical protein